MSNKQKVLNMLRRALGDSVTMSDAGDMVTYHFEGYVGPVSKLELRSIHNPRIIAETITLNIVKRVTIDIVTQYFKETYDDND